MVAEKPNVDEFDVFVSYATAADYKLARKLEAFLESIHRTRTGREAGLKALNVCLDGSDFTRAGRSNEVGEVIRHHLLNSRRLLVLCSKPAMISDWVRTEIRVFLERNDAAQILLAVTDVPGPGEDPEAFFCPEIVSAGLHRTVWYDFRGATREGRRSLHARDFASERLRLVAELHDRSASSIEPLWQREQAAATRLRLGGAAVTIAVLAAVVTAALFQSRERARQEAFNTLLQAAQVRSVDPFTAIGQVIGVNPRLVGEQRDAELAAVHEILVDRRQRAVADRNRRVPRWDEPQDPDDYVRPPFSEISPDGRFMLFATTAQGEQYDPIRPGEAYLIDVETSSHQELDCTDPELRDANPSGFKADYRLDFARFGTVNRFFVVRFNHMQLYDTDGRCLGTYDLQGTKSGMTAATGLMYDVFLALGNGSGCLWVEEYGYPGSIKPAVVNEAASPGCDLPANEADGIVDLAVVSGQSKGLIQYGSGRLDIFTIAGRGKLNTETIHASGVVTSAFRGNSDDAIIVATDEPDLALWRSENGKPEKEQSIPIPAGAGTIDFVGFSDDGDILSVLDSECRLMVWDMSDLSAPLEVRGFEKECR